MKSLNVLVAGGGTGGHIYPALAIAKGLLTAGHKVLYVTRKDSMEEELAKAKNIDYVNIEVRSFDRKFSFKNFNNTLIFIKAYQECLKVIDTFKPDKTFATGGYTTAPVLFASFNKKIPYVIHEPDSHMGLANRLFSYAASGITLGMEVCKYQIPNYQKKIYLTGNPIDAKFGQNLDKNKIASEYKLNPDFKTIIVTGGSQGASAINNVTLDIAPRLLLSYPNLQIVHQTGKKNYAEVLAKLSDELKTNPRYLVQPYFDDMASLYALSDLAICRSGAMTISELIASGLPAIFIPYPYAAQNHQYYNAEFLENSKAGLLINQSELTSEKLYGAIADLFDNINKLASFKANLNNLTKPNSTSEIINILLTL